jgi:energy-coupling factor transporter ATP-binding protein EcfA2
MGESIPPQSPSSPAVDPDHPWLGLHPFAEENHRYFFGRTAELRDLFLRVRENTLTVLYGQSGLGKTSLLQAGLIPKLRVERFQPLRVLLDFTEMSPPLVDQLRAALAAACAGPGGDVTALLQSWAPLSSLWEICAHELIRPRELAEKPPVLIIDQFEEVFTLGEEPTSGSAARRAEVVELCTEIADLVENRAPASLQTTFQHETQRALAYDFGPKPIRVVLSLREDFLAQVEQWKNSIPSLMRNRMQLRPLTGPQALEAVVRPGRMEGRNLVSDQVGEQIVRFVANRHPDTPLQEIEAVPPLLSLLCEQLNEARLKQRPQLSELSTELVASHGADILQRFYEESFAGLKDSEREAVREYVEDRMITRVGGHRNPVAREDALTELKDRGVSAPDAALDALIARRLLTAERRGGIQRLEITHDVLTPLALRGRKERQERRDIEQAKRKQAEAEAQVVREAELREEAKRKQEEAEARLIREKRLRSRLRYALVGMTVLLFLALGAVIIAFQQKRRADKSAARARERSAFALQQMARAEEQSAVALQQKNIAEKRSWYVALGRKLLAAATEADATKEGRLAALDQLRRLSEALPESAELRQLLAEASVPTSSPSVPLTRLSMTAAEYQRVCDDLKGQGYRLTGVSGYDVGGQARYAAIWEKRNGPPWEARSGLTSAQYQQTSDDLTKRGYRPAQVTAYGIGGQAFFAGIWEQRSGPDWQARHDMTASEYQGVSDDLKGQGYRLTDVSGYNVGGQVRYAAIWEKSNWPPCEARYGLTLAQYQQTFDDLTKRGYRLVHVSAYGIDGQAFYACIWEQRSGPNWLAITAVTAAEYERVSDDMKDQGFQLTEVSGYEVGGHDYYAAIWEKSI